uniref:Uncharacterized protein n=1 Tax=Anguilla anguilla TaxID=7936 RepID=A0A0E9XJK1_ANGAN
MLGGWIFLFWPRLQNLDHLSACTLSYVRGGGVM